MAKDAYRYFRIEARELLDGMSQAALDLEKDIDREGALQRLLRLAHTLKGAARVVRQVEMAEHAHAVEDILEPMRADPQAVTGAAITAVLARLDAIESGLVALPSALEAASAPSQPAQPAVSDQAPPTPAESPRQTASQAQPQAQSQAPRHSEPDGPSDDQPAAPIGWRATADDLQAVLSGLADSHAQASSLGRHHLALAQAKALADSLFDQLVQRRPRGPGAGAAWSAPGHAAQDTAAALRDALDTLSNALGQTGDQLLRGLRQTREHAEQLKLVPVTALLTVLERTARDVARAQGKVVSFHTEGSLLRLDAALLQAVQPALVQLVRNAVAHGIEPPARRQAAGKPPTGRVCVALRQQDGHIAFACMDDGQGIDGAVVWRSARDKGLAAGQPQPGDAAALLRLLLQGGVSTAEQVTEVSGRGIGLNVVADALRRLHGRAQLDTRIGQGSTLTLTFPMTLAACAALQMHAGQRTAALAMEAIVRTMRVARDELVDTPEGPVVMMGGQPLPFLPLAIALDAAPASGTSAASAMSPKHWSIVVVQSGAGLAAIGVDRLGNASQIVMQPVPAWTPVSPLIAGIALDAEGQPQPMLSAAGLVRAASVRRVSLQKTAPKPAPVLVIDDSLTTRMLEQSILETAGYEVETAASAEEGLLKAREKRHALFLVDVDMPGMDGFTFVETTRADPELARTPAILVTSRASQEDRDRGRAVGASAYIVKGDFAQNAFLESVRRLTQTT